MDTRRRFLKQRLLEGSLKRSGTWAFQACGKICMDMGNGRFVGWEKGSFIQYMLKEKMSSPTEKEARKEEKGTKARKPRRLTDSLCEQVKGQWDPIKRLRGVQRGGEDVGIIKGQARQKKALEDVGLSNQD